MRLVSHGLPDTVLNTAVIPGSEIVTLPLLTARRAGRSDAPLVHIDGRSIAVVVAVSMIPVAAIIVAIVVAVGVVPITAPVGAVAITAPA